MNEYIFKLTPNKNTVIINTSVLSVGKYEDVSYPLVLVNDDISNYFVDKDTYKFVTTDTSLVFPVSLDISGYVEDINFYAKNNEITNVSIYPTYQGSVINNSTSYFIRNQSTGRILYNLIITPIWNTLDASINSSCKLDCSIIFEKIENISILNRDVSNIDIVSNFNDISLYVSLLKNKSLNISDSEQRQKFIEDKLDLLVISSSTRSFSIDGIKPKTISINSSTFAFRDSLYEGRRHVGNLKIKAEFKYGDTGMSVFNSAVFPIYQIAYPGSVYRYAKINLVDKSKPLDLWSPTISYTYCHSEYDNPKLDSDTNNVINTFTISGSYNPNISNSSALTKFVNSDNHIDTSENINVLTYDNYVILPYDYMYTSSGQIILNDSSTDISIFNKNIKDCALLSATYLNTSNNKNTSTGKITDINFGNIEKNTSTEKVIDTVLGNEAENTSTKNDDSSIINRDSSILKQCLYINDINPSYNICDDISIIVNTNVIPDSSYYENSIDISTISFYATYAKYQIIGGEYKQKKGTDYFDDVLDHPYIEDFFKDIINEIICDISPNYKKVDASKIEAVNTYGINLRNPINASIIKIPITSLDFSKNVMYSKFKFDSNDNRFKIINVDNTLTQYVYCVNNPFEDPTFKIPVFATYPILSGTIPVKTYVYDFTNSTVDNSSYEIDYAAFNTITVNGSNALLDNSYNIITFENNQIYINTNNLIIRPTNTVNIGFKPTIPGSRLYGNSENTNAEQPTYYTINISSNTDILSKLIVNGGKQDNIDNIIDSSVNISPYIFKISTLDSSIFDQTSVSDITITNNNTNDGLKGKLVITNDEGEKHLHNFKHEGKDINNNLESFMLLRANPKLSGNIKLVVDSEYNLYLDTFKSSDQLNNSKYRKYPISAEGNYPRDIRQVFKSLPNSELYKTSKNSLNAHKIYTDYNDQYETMYEYGAETNTDVLYPENMRILAPLHIGKNIPEFFTIFRYDGVFNNETETTGFVDINKFKSLIKSSEVVKTIDLRQYTSIGQYLNNYKDMIQNFGYGQCGLQFIEQDNYVNSDSYRQGKNIWKGILINQGILTEQSETSYFANKILNDSSLPNKQELFNHYIQAGFERHGLLYPNIINLEYMFNDNDNDEYTMHRYFGLYLYENDFIEYGFITDKKIGNNNVLIKYDTLGNIYNGDLTILRNIFNEKYNDRIFYAVSNDIANRVKSETDVDAFLSDNIKNSPEYNIVNVNADRISFDKTQKSFVTLHFKQPMQYGEHIKFILLDVVDKTHAYTNTVVDSSLILSKHYVYEIIASNDDRLRYAENNINPYVTTHVCEFNNSVIFKRISFYSLDTLYPDVTASIPEQINRIISCINKFKEDNVLFVSYNDKTSLSIISSHNNTYIQHIAAPNLNSFKYDYLHINGIYNNNIHLCNTNKNISSLKYITENISTNLSINNQLYSEDHVYLNELDRVNDPKYYSYIESEDVLNIKEDNISYYNKSITYNMKAISNVTEYYDSYYIPFSNYMFESLGWRHNTVVKFINTNDIPNTYVLYNDITDKIKDILTPLVFNNVNMYETILKFNINAGYISNNIINPIMWSNFSLRRQEFITDNLTNIIITNPFNSNYNIITSTSDILLQNNVIRLYKPKSALIAVMGISNIKDIDVNVESKIDIHRESKLSAYFKENEVVKIDESDIRIQHAVMYQVVSGILKANATKLMQGDMFICIDSNTIRMSRSNDKILSSILTALTDTEIKLIDKQKYQEYNYTTLLPVIKLNHFFKDVNDIYNSDLMYPIVPQVNCAWKSTGLYIDDNNVLDTDNMDKSYEQKNGHFTESVFTPDMFESNQYVINKIDNILYVDGIPTTYKECIINKSLTHAIKKLLINDVNINTAICHYNPNTYSLEFIYFGLKFVIKFNDKVVNTYLHLDKYNNYNVFILNEYDLSKTNELYISDHDEFILLINHQFYIDLAHEGDNNIKNITVNTRNTPIKVPSKFILTAYNDMRLFSGYAPYSTYKAPINIDVNTIYNNEKMLVGYLKQNTGNVIDNIDIHNLWSSWIILETDNTFMYSPLESIMSTDNIISFVNYNNSDKYYYSKSDNNTTLDESYIMTKSDGNKYYQITLLLSGLQKFKKNIDLNETLLSELSNKSAFDILADTSISTTVRLTAKSTNALLKFTRDILYVESIRDKQQRYINSITDNIDIYVIPENSEYKLILNRTSYNPLMFNVTIPNYIKYNYGLFTPNVNNMVLYNINDIELGNIIDVDLLCANTNISGISKLLNYTGNKVFETSDNKVLLNYFMVPERSLLSSTWDYGYYRLYTSENNYKDYEGLLTGIDDKSFFGSRCIIIKHPYIELNTWKYETSNDLYSTSIIDSEFNTNTDNRKCLLLVIKLSSVLYHFFINNKNFVNNWKEFNDGQFTGMKNYINNTMMSYYNLNSDVDLLIYKLDTKTNASINIIETNETNTEYQLYENYKSDITFVNNEYILTIVINDTTGMDIHPVLKIYRK